MNYYLLLTRLVIIQIVMIKGRMNCRQKKITSFPCKHLTESIHTDKHSFRMCALHRCRRHGTDIQKLQM